MRVKLGTPVSDEAPTDPDVKVWLKPDGEAPEFATKSDLAGKADLEPTTKTVLPAQISPLQGRQTGVVPTDGMYRSTAPALLFKGSRTVEALIKLGPNPAANETIFDMRGDGSNIRIDIVPGNMIACYSGSAFTLIQGIEGEYYHLVIRLDSDNNTSALFLNGVPMQTINSVIGNPSYFNIGGYGDTGILRFGGVIHNLRTFNYALSDDECLLLWNGGRPNEYMVAGVGSMREGLVAEYLPCGLLTDKWRDTSGNGLDLAAMGSPKLSYETVPDMAVNTLAVTVTGTAAAPVYSFTQYNFLQVANAVSNGCEPIVKITDSRTAANKPVDLSGIYPAVWNAALNQIEVRDPNVARGLYLEVSTTKSRGCVTTDTPKYIDRGKNSRSPELSCAFDALTGFYRLNGLDNLTEQEMRDIYCTTSGNILSAYQNEMFRYLSFRTNFPPIRLGSYNGYSFVQANVAFADNYSLVVANIGCRYYSLVNFMFQSCRNLKKILGEIIVNTASFGNAFYNCPKLEDVKIRGNGNNISFISNPLLNKESLVFLLTTRSNAVGSSFTVTLHPTVFAWASVDAEVQALLAATATQGAVTLASA